MKSKLGAAMRRIPGRPEVGQWMHITVEDPISGAVELVEFQERGGRLNPPRSFPVMYCAEDSKPCRAAMNRSIEEDVETGTKFVVLHLDIHLPKILDLDDAKIRRRLGLTLTSLTDPKDMRLTQRIGAAAHAAGFAGVVYPRPQGKGGLNLALFCDRTSPREVSIVGAGAPKT